MSQVDFEAVLAVGREKGQLTQAELIEALHTVELTPEVLIMLIDRVTAEGVALVEDEEEDPIVEVDAAQGGAVRAALERGRRQANGAPGRRPDGSPTASGPARGDRAAAPRTPSTRT